MTKIRSSSMVDYRTTGGKIAQGRVVGTPDSDPRCDVMIVDLRNVDRAIMIPRSDIVAVTEY